MPAVLAPNVLPDASIPRVAQLPALQHLLAIKPADQVVALNAMSISLLQRLLQYVKKGALRTFILDTLSAKKSDLRQKRSRTFFVAPFASSKIDSVSLRRLLCKSPDWPLSDVALKECGVAFQMNLEVGRTLRNFTDSSLNVSACDVQCDCEQYPDEFKFTEPDGVKRHVLTADPLVFHKLFPEPGHADLMGCLLMQRGSKFRYSKNDLVTSIAVAEAAESFLRRCAKKENVDLSDEQVDKWVSGFRQLVDKALKCYDPSRRLQPDLRKIAATAHERFVITPADKNPQHSVIWCKKLYHDTIRSALNASFSACEESALEVIQRHEQLARKYWHRGHASLPYLYAMPKLHKLETHRAPFRFIVGKAKKNHPELPENTTVKEASGRNTLTNVRKHLASALDGIIDLLLIKQRDENVKRCWIVRDTQEFIDSTATLQVDESTCITTADFTTMYTQLPHDVVVENVCSAIDDAMPVLRDLNGLPQNLPPERVGECVLFGTDGQWFVPSTTDKRLGWTARQIKQAVRDLVSEAFVLSDGELRRQTIGIGMGHEESPPLANLTLYTIEKNFVEEVVRRYPPEQVEEIFHNFKYHRRFIDDIFAPTPPALLPTQEAYGLQYAVTGSARADTPDSNVVFLGINVNFKNNRLVYAARDKQHAFNFTLTRFPSWESCHPKACKHGTVLGMLTRTLRFTTEIEAVIKESKHILRCFIQRGYPLDVLEKVLRSFGRRQLLSSGRRLIATPLLTWLKDYESEQPARAPTPPPPPPQRESHEHEAVSSEEDEGDAPVEPARFRYKIIGVGTANPRMVREPIAHSEQSTQTPAPAASAEPAETPSRPRRPLVLRMTRPRDESDVLSQQQPPQPSSQQPAPAAAAAPPREPSVVPQQPQVVNVYNNNVSTTSSVSNVSNAPAAPAPAERREAHDDARGTGADPSPHRALTVVDNSRDELINVCRGMVSALTESIALHRANRERNRMPEGQEALSFALESMRAFQHQITRLMREQQEMMRQQTQLLNDRPRLHGDFLLSLKLLVQQIADRPVNVNVTAPQVEAPVAHNHLTLEAPPLPALNPTFAPVLTIESPRHDTSAQLALLEGQNGRMLQALEAMLTREQEHFDRLLAHSEAMQSNALIEMRQIVQAQHVQFTQQHALSGIGQFIEAVDGNSARLLAANQQFMRDCIAQLSTHVTSARGFMENLVETAMSSRRISDQYLEHLANEHNQSIQHLLQASADHQTAEGKFRSSMMAVIERALQQQPETRQLIPLAIGAGPTRLRIEGPAVAEPSQPRRLFNESISVSVSVHRSDDENPEAAAQRAPTELRASSVTEASREDSPPPREPQSTARASARAARRDDRKLNRNYWEGEASQRSETKKVRAETDEATDLEQRDAPDPP